MSERLNPADRARRNWLLAGVIVALLVVDRLTKLIAIEALSGRPAEDYLGGFLRLIFQENHGAMLSLGAGLPESIRFLFFTVLVALVLVALLLFVLLKRTLAVKDAIAAALVIGGGFGNVIDRLLYDGAVLDFLNIGIGDLRTGVFNVADIAILAGAVVFILGPRKPNGPAVRREEGEAPPGH
jgi:signal peptidase II